MIVQEICAEQYLYWQSLGWTHHEMLTAVGRSHAVDMAGDTVILEMGTAWQSLNRIGCVR